MNNAINEHEQQALDFLKKTNTTFEAKYIGTYDRNDFCTTDNYEITLARGDRSYSFEFSQSLHRSGKWHIREKSPSLYYKRIYAISHTSKKPFSGLSLTSPNIHIKDIDNTYIVDDDVNFAFVKLQLQLDKAEIIINESFQAPSPYDILTCLEKYGYENFEDFCASLDYSEDSIKAKDIYIEVLEEYSNMQRLFNNEEMEELREIQ